MPEPFIAMPSVEESKAHIVDFEVFSPEPIVSMSKTDQPNVMDES